jgi:hypothetical protein
MTIQTKLPHRMGSIQMRGKVYWMIYPDSTGKAVQENSKTDKPLEALHLLAKRALRTLAARRLAVLEVLRGTEAEKATGPRAKGHRKSHPVSRQAGRRRAVRGDAARSGDGRSQTQGGTE